MSLPRSTDKRDETTQNFVRSIGDEVEKIPWMSQMIFQLGNCGQASGERKRDSDEYPCAAERAATAMRWHN